MSKRPKKESKISNLKSQINKIDELVFVRVIYPAAIQFIPRYLFEQIEGIDKEKIDLIYSYAQEILTIPVVNNQGRLIRVANPVIWFAVLHDLAHQIKGFVWSELDFIEGCIFVQMCSVDKQYQSGDGAVINRITAYLFGLNIPYELKRNIRMATSRPKAFENFGWKRSSKILMEIENADHKD